jgi:acetyl esterase/lipase
MNGTAQGEDESVLTRSASPPHATIRYGEFEDQVADVRYADDSAKSRPLLIVIHGGFWRPRYDRLHTAPMCAALAQAGWTVAAIEYRRLPGNAAATFADVCAALTHLPAMVDGHNGSAIAVGHSAGGQLALWAAVSCGLAKLAAVLALAPVADMNYAHTHALGNHAIEAFLGSPPDRTVDPCLMPSPRAAVTVVHGMQDEIVPPAMSQNYCRAHPRTRLVTADHCGHFAVIDPQSAVWPTVLAELKLLLNR